MIHVEGLEIRLVTDKKAELDQLQKLDRELFPTEEPFDSEFWVDSKTRVYWVLWQGNPIGMTVLATDSTVADSYNDDLRSEPGTLYIISTGLIDQYRRRGMGYAIKEWQIAEAGRLGQQRIVTNCRMSNLPIQKLNAKVGFRSTRVIPSFFTNPTEDSLVMELEVMNT